MNEWSAETNQQNNTLKNNSLLNNSLVNIVFVNWLYLNKLTGFYELVFIGLKVV